MICNVENIKVQVVTANNWSTMILTLDTWGVPPFVGKIGAVASPMLPGSNVIMTAGAYGSANNTVTVYGNATTPTMVNVEVMLYGRWK